MSIFMPDLRTLVLFSGASGGVLALVMFFLRRSYPASIRGLRQWGVALSLLSAAAPLYATRDLLPDFLSIFCANFLLLAGSLAVYLGLRRFYGQGFNARWVVLVLAISGLLLAWWSLLQPATGARIALVASFQVAVSLTSAYVVLRYARRSFAVWLLTATLLVLALNALWRIMIILMGDGAFGVLAHSAPLTLYAVVQSLAFPTLAVSLILLASDRLHRELDYLVTHDPQTSALSRHAVMAECECEIERCRRYGRVMSLLMLDLDHFKSINDVHGHLVGDAVLVDFVARASQTLRGPDRLGRFGGEEFTVLLPETPAQEAMAVAERIRSLTAKRTSGLPPYTVSIGVTSSRSSGEDDLEALLRRADKALYQAKAEGRNRVVFVS